METISTWDGSNSSTGSSYGSRAVRFSAIQEALGNLGRLPETHSFHVDAAVTRRASDLLAVIAENYGVAPPRIFPQDGEAVVLTWEQGPVKRYVTVDEDEVSVMDLHRTLQVRCHHDLPAADGEKYTALVTLLGAEPMSVSLSENDV